MSTIVRHGGTTARWLGRRGLLVRLLPVLLVLSGVAVFVYPVLATRYNNLKQHQFAQEYNRDVASAPSSMLADQLAGARAYNSRINGIPILDPWLTKVSRDPTSAAYRAYLGRLSGLPAMARLKVPSVGIDLPVYHGTSDATLASGVGHLYGTSLPVGGAGTHAVLTSHTGMTNATLFDHLVDVRQGAVLTIDVFGETLAYRVDQITVVLPDDVHDLRPVAGEDLVTLMTCTPYGVNSHRLLVRGHRVPTDLAAARAAGHEVTGTPIEPWMYWLMAGALAGLLALVAIAVGTVRRSRS